MYNSIRLIHLIGEAIPELGSMNTYPHFSGHIELAALVAVLIFIGAVIPAAWSRDPSKRKDALKVLLHFFRRKR